ncbi:unnamed protein product [Calypogeia fissa]
MDSDEMDSDDDMEFEDDSAEIMKYEEETMANLRGKKLIVQNPDGTLRCPLSPSRKKQAYAYKDLLQHATAVASGKRGPEAAGNHSALKKFLESDLASLASPAPERLLKVKKEELPLRRHAVDMLVCPWSVVVYNIDNSRRDPTKVETQIGLGKSELNIYFADFKPEKIHVLWGPQGHLGMCVLHFGRDLSGFKDAQALENSFLDKEHGLRDHERRLASGNLGKEFYGWIAREDDLNGRFGRQGEEIGKYLRKVGNLKDIEMVGDEIRRMHEQQVRQLAVTVSEKNKESEVLKTQMEIIRRTSEAEREQLEESHKLELEAIQIKARNSEEEYNRATLESHRNLEKREAELSQRDKELREKESHLTSAAEKSILQNQLMENLNLREMLSKQQGILQEKSAEKIRLVQKHEGETMKLFELAQKEALKLAKRQKNEMEKQQLHTIIETEKLFDKLTINPTVNKDTGHDSQTQGQEELERKRRFEEMERKLEELESSHEFNEETISVLIRKERDSTDEIVDARQMAVQVLQDLKDEAKALIEAALKKKFDLEKRKQPSKQPQARVAVKMVGSIDETPWISAFQKKHRNDPDWGLKMKTKFSKWEKLIRNSAFQPLKTVEIGNDKWEMQIDHENTQLSALKKELGGEVYDSVTTALLELEEFNASGRYPVPVAWNFEKFKKASLKETVAYLGEVVEALVLETNAPRKRTRN